MSIDAKHGALAPRVVALYDKLADGDVMGMLESLDRDIEWVVPDGLTSQFAHVWRLRDGQPVGFETIPDTHAMVRTMGVEPS